MRDDLKDRLDQWAEREIARARADDADPPVAFLAAARLAATSARADRPDSQPLALRLRLWLPLAAACLAIIAGAVILGPGARAPLTPAPSPVDIASGGAGANDAETPIITIIEDDSIGPALADIMRASNRYTSDRIALPKDASTPSPAHQPPPPRATDRALRDQR